MLFSYNWLQTYFEKKLPPPQEIAELLIFHALEVESVTPEGDDWIFELAVLPHRRHDCLSHRGIAREISVLAGVPMAHDPFQEKVPAWNTPIGLTATVENTDGCPRYMAALMQGVAVDESPDWLKKRLRAVGQKPVNNIVDATNYVMFHLGQPLHAFDAGLFSAEGELRGIGVRDAQKGERITALGGQEHLLQENDLVIVDGMSDAPIGIAGIKGGTAREITVHTKNIIIESANFNPARVRQTAMRLGLRTDASLRFESGLAPEQAEYALREVVMLIEKLTGAELLGVSDIGKWQKKVAPIPLSADEINKLLGTNMDIGILKNVLEELRFEYTEQGKEVHVTPPFERLDVEMKEDLIEEVGRVYGYEKVKAVPLPKADASPAVNKNFYYMGKIRDILVERGFSEVYTHAIGAEGSVGLENPLAEDKRFLRDGLANSQFDSLVLQNERNKKLFDGGTIKIFEMGKAFREKDEQWELVLGSESENEVRDAEMALASFGISSRGTGGVVERHVLMIEALPEPPHAYEPYKKSEIEPRYRPISDFPPVFRDIAVFVPKDVTSEAVREIIVQEAGGLLVSVRLFDEFRKDGKISYAFRLVFQSHEKTLSDNEVNEIMVRITGNLNTRNGFSVR
ncbi:MAG: hypothetical protein A3D67_00045 [Candidatus Lloydbacteria bacterium RIFCSPHIGHO2_02_FULL_51_22]|uniref:Uncharacterized protein n=2 Tax=Candidatus Lloydiibacteriota TaxID=1817910 RepID=A0A1G2DFP6_9BACT|nr:MAG: hypothetical protein A3D67_00045 [Candidatus Lloydbacteria bacterium RIFCSPHIGHO2_02_FULL_51_22]OGZ14813.1 MAG: hypothetical protein A3J08_00545 [Candidatus Lloydbacteria bacterium RIFCSPLOWO2_02_FULL_51_11]